MLASDDENEMITRDVINRNATRVAVVPFGSLTKNVHPWSGKLKEVVVYISAGNETVLQRA